MPENLNKTPLSLNMALLSKSVAKTLCLKRLEYVVRAINLRDDQSHTPYTAKKPCKMYPKELYCITFKRVKKN